MTTTNNMAIGITSLTSFGYQENVSMTSSD